MSFSDFEIVFKVLFSDILNMHLLDVLQYYAFEKPVLNTHFDCLSTFA